MRRDRTLRRNLNLRHYQAAEVRLGRPLNPGERLVDVVEILAALEQGKERLSRAIRKEQKRVAEQASGGRDGEMRVTDEMVAALNWLHVLGQREARKELRAHGVEPVRHFARPRSGAVRALINRLAGYLPTISIRTRRRAVEVQLAGEAQRAVLESAVRVPGALDAAGRLVSSAMYAGMGDVFSASADLISGWTYSAILDGATCDECASKDGTHYDTWDDAQEDMPDGGPNPACYGDGRCRCRLVPEGPTEGEPAPEPPPAPADILSGADETSLNATMDLLQITGRMERSPDGVILRDGKLFRQDRGPDLDLPEGQKQQCYANSWHISMDHPDLTYVEGYVSTPDLPIPIAHAWNVDKEGRVYDTTLRDLKDPVYVGVPLQTDWIRTEAIKRRATGPFIDHRFPYLTKRVPDTVVDRAIPGKAVSGIEHVPPNVREELRQATLHPEIQDKATPDEIAKALDAGKSWSGTEPGATIAGKQGPLTEIESSTVDWYAGGDSAGAFDLNDSLRGVGEPLDAPSWFSSRYTYGDLANLLDDAVAKGVTTKEGVLYRRIRGDYLGNFLNASTEDAVGKIASDPAFMSSTTKREWAERLVHSERNDMVLELRVPAGQPALSVNAALGEGTDSAHEAEIILPRNTQVVIDSVSRSADDTYYVATGHVVPGAFPLPPQAAIDLAKGRLEPTIVDQATKEEIAAFPGGRSGPVKTDDPAVAAKAIGDGKNVELEQTKDVATLLDELAKMSREAQVKGSGHYDLGKVSVKGTNLFTRESLGIPRAQMPQLSGKPLAGSKAAGLPVNKHGEVDITQLFMKHLRDSGIQVDEADVKVSQLKATQSELDGEKVAGIMDFLESGGVIDGRITVSDDNYIVDGHHRWAAQVGLDYRGDQDAGMTIAVERIHQPIQTILNEANAFAKDWGIPQQSVFTGKIAEPTIKRGVADAKQIGQLVDQIRPGLADDGLTVAGRPATSEGVWVNRAAQLASRVMPMADEEELVNFIDRVVIEERHGLTPPVDKVTQDYFVDRGWDIALVERGIYGVRAFLRQEGGQLKLTLEGKRGEKFSSIDDVGDLFHTWHNSQVVISGTQGSQQDASAGDAVPGSFLSPNILNSLLDVPVDATPPLYFGVPANPNGSGRFVGCFRYFEENGQQKMQICGRNGKWTYVPPPPLLDLANARPITPSVAAQVVVRTMAVVRTD